MAPRTAEHNAAIGRALTQAIPKGRVCSRCRREKGARAFGRRGVNRRWLRHWCRVCEREYRREYYHRDKSGARQRYYDNKLRRYYGLTPERFDEILADQGGACAICACPPAESRYGRLFIDHDHATGNIRGLLCNRCNAVIGRIADDVQLLAAAIRYLEANRNIGKVLGWRNGLPRRKSALKAPHSRKGSRNPRAILNESKAAEIRHALSLGEPRKQLANSYGVTVSTIHAIARGRLWPASLEANDAASA